LARAALIAKPALTVRLSAHVEALALSQKATVYTHLGQGINVLRDPPKSPRWRAAALEKRGTLNPVPPFLRGVRGDLSVTKGTTDYF